MEQSEFTKLLRLELEWRGDEISGNIAATYKDHVYRRFIELLSKPNSKEWIASEAAILNLEHANSEQISAALELPQIAYIAVNEACLVNPFWRSYLFMQLCRSLGHADPAKMKQVTLNEPEGVNSGAIQVAVNALLPIPKMDRGGNRTASIAAALQNPIIGKLQRACDRIGECRGPVRLIRNGTQVIDIREELEFPQIFASGSFRELPGLSLLLNAGNCDISEHRLANAVLHEAIHGVIYKYETCGKLLVRKSVPSSHRIVSVWTGTPLTVDSFVQACFVWYGLYKFWAMVSLADHAVPFLEKALAGFISPLYLERCEQIEMFLAEGVCDVLRSMQRSF